jgi:hypothetical protein
MNMVSRIAAAAVLVGFAVIGAPAHADSRLPQIGGRGGAGFSERCPLGQVLNGFEVRAGDDIDAIRAVCVMPSSPTAVSAPLLSNGFGGGWHGGGGGSLRRLLCPPGTPVVNAIQIEAEGFPSGTFSVNEIDIYCDAIGSAGSHDYPSNGVHAPRQPLDNDGAFYVGNTLDMDTQKQTCPAGEVGIGMHGHSGALVDAMGLICGPAPTFAPPRRYVKAMGHTRTKTPLQRAAEDATVVRDGSAANRAVTARPSAVSASTAVKSTDVRVAKPAAASANRKAIIIVGGQPQPKAKQPTVPERIHDYEDQHH